MRAVSIAYIFVVSLALSAFSAPVPLRQSLELSSRQGTDPTFGKRTIRRELDLALRDKGDDDDKKGSPGRINEKPDACGKPNASEKPTKISGPMGSIDYLNCGIEGSGWNPPDLKVKDLITVSLSEAIKSDDSPFKACSKYVPLFEKYATENGLPAILLASFALQESSCNPGTVGGGSEQGLMQITKEKCKGAPGGDCKDPEFNIRTAAQYFKKTLDGVGGNVVQAVGTYNGWSPGLTIAKATAAQHSGCCRCQNNLDYLQQFFNGWIQNVDAYKAHMGKYFNLDKCHK